MNEMQPLSLTISPWSWRLRMTKETKFDQNSSFQTYRFYSINPFQWRELVYLIIYLPHSFIRLYKCLIGTQYLSQKFFFFCFIDTTIFTVHYNLFKFYSHFIKEAVFLLHPLCVIITFVPAILNHLFSVVFRSISHHQCIQTRRKNRRYFEHNLWMFFFPTTTQK